MRVNLLKAELIRQDKSINWLAEQLGYTNSNLYYKLNGRSELTVREANIIRKLLALDDDLARDIFFTDEVE